MPGGDGTGPLGIGPMTGCRSGYWAGYDVSGYAGMRRFPGRGPRCGAGLGRLGIFAAGGLLARNFFSTMSRVDEKALLLEESKVMEDRLNDIKQRLSRLEQDE